MAALTEKLENCEVCGAHKAKYTCPKCEVRTCCLTCVNVHKKELECDGIRDKTKFVPLKSFTDLDLLSDYRLLEEVGRSVDQLKRDPTKRCTRQADLPPHLHKLKLAATRRKVYLQFMPQHFSRHKINTTFLNWKTNQLFWRLEFIFPQAENIKWVIGRALESTRLSVLLEEILDPVASLDNKADIEQLNFRLSVKERLQYYRAAGLPNIKVLLKAEKILKSNSRFYELELSSTIAENLENKTVIEFPVLYVIMKNHSDMYDIVDTDEECKNKSEFGSEENTGRKRKWIKREHDAKKKDQPINYFFNDDFSESEDDITPINERNTSVLPKAGFQLPTYDDLVKMEL